MIKMPTRMKLCFKLRMKNGISNLFPRKHILTHKARLAVVPPQPTPEAHVRSGFILKPVPSGHSVRRLAPTCSGESATAALHPEAENAKTKRVPPPAAHLSHPILLGTYPYPTPQAHFYS